MASPTDPGPWAGKISQLKRQLDQERAASRAATAHAEALAAAIRDIHASRSWRITAPLRAAIDTVRRLRAQPHAGLPPAPPPPTDNPAPASPKPALRVLPGDERGRELLARGGSLNPASLVLWNGLLDERPWTHVLDIGANYGEMLLGARLPASARVMAFEPDPDVRACLEHNLQSAGVTCEVSPLAVSDRIGQAGLLRDAAWTGLTRLARPGEQPDAMTVATTTLEAVLGGAERAPGISLLVKIDVEGHEKSVLTGLLPMLDRLDGFAGLAEIIHLNPDDRQWLLDHFDIELLHHGLRDTLPVSPATPETLTRLLADKAIYGHDAILRRKGSFQL